MATSSSPLPSPEAASVPSASEPRPAAAAPRDARCRRCGLAAWTAGGEGCERCGHGVADEFPVRSASWIARLSHGFLSVPRGVGFVAARPGLYPWLLASLPLTFLIMVGLVAAAWRLQSEVTGWALEGWDGWLWGSLAWSISLGGWMLTLAAAWLVFGEICKLVCLPFSEVIARRVEAERLAGLSGESAGSLLSSGAAAVQEVSKSVLHGVLLLPVKLAILVISLPLVAVPVVGPVIWWGLPGAIFNAFDFLDLPVARRAYSFAEKLTFMQRHGYEVLGLGLGVCLILAIPFFGLVLLPAAAAGATVLYLELEPK